MWGRTAKTYAEKSESLPLLVKYKVQRSPGVQERLCLFAQLSICPFALSARKAWPQALQGGALEAINE